MLLEFAVRNFRSFKGEQRLSMVAGRDQRHEDCLVNAAQTCVRVAAIYGANASGKSNLFKAFSFARRFILDSATRINTGDPIDGIEPFKFDEDSKVEPSAFEFLMEINSEIFQYGFSATKTRVHSEWLFKIEGLQSAEIVEPPKHAAKVTRVRWFERDCGQIEENQHWKYGSRSPFTTDDKRLLEERTRENGLALSRGADLNVAALQLVFLWFRNLVISDLSQNSSWLVNNTAVKINEDPKLRDDVLSLLREADLQIAGVTLSERPLLDAEEYKEYFGEKFLKLLKSHKNFRVSLVHEIPGKGLFDIDMDDESLGTQRMFGIAGHIVDAIRNAQVLFIDELDCSLHPLLTHKIVEIFQHSRSNSQIVFNTHDTTLLDEDLLRRDQVWFAEKNANQETQLFSLADLRAPKVRSTESFEKNYLSGKYGGIPQLGHKFGHRLISGRKTPKKKEDGETPDGLEEDQTLAGSKR